MLFFISKKIFAPSYYRNAIANIFIFLSLTLLLTTLLEYILIRVIGFPPYIFPWYRYSFMMNERFVGGYIDTLQTPILGLLGWPHDTAAIFVALFAFSFPYFFKRIKINGYTNSSVWAIKFPNWLSYSIVVFTAFAVFIVLAVKTHMVTYIFVLLFLPFITKGKNLLRNIFIVLCLIIIVLNSNTFQLLITKKIIEGFVGNNGQLSTLATIIPENPVADLINRPIINIFLGKWDYYYTGELRLLTYTARFGLVWFFLFVGIFTAGVFHARKIISNRFVRPYDYLFAVGSIGLLSVYFLDMGHYAKTLFSPNIDILFICLGTLASINNKI